MGAGILFLKPIWERGIGSGGKNGKPLKVVFLKKDFICLFLERGEGEGEKEGQKHWLPLAYPQPETWPGTQTYTLTRNQTSELLPCGMTPNSLSYTSHGSFYACA